MDFLTVTVMRDAGFEAFDNIAGGETAGIPFAALVAERLALPMTYVRKKPKGYGRNARIEGVMTEGQRVLLVEDLTTDGGSKLVFVDAIRETGATCAHTAVIFYYGIFPETTQRLADHGVALHHLCTWWDVLAEARAHRSLRRRDPGRGRSFPARSPRLAGRAHDGMKPPSTSCRLVHDRILDESNGPTRSGDRHWRQAPDLVARIDAPRYPDGSTAGSPQAYQALASAPPNRHHQRHRRQTGHDNAGGSHERNCDLARNASGPGLRGRGAAAQYRGRTAASGRDPDQQRCL